MSVQFLFHHLPSYTLATLRAKSPQSPRFAHSPLLSVSTLDLSSTLILEKPQICSLVYYCQFLGQIGLASSPAGSLAIPQFSLVLVPFGNRTLRTAPGWLMAICKQNVPEEVCDMCLTNQKWVAQKVASVCKRKSVLIYRVS